MSTSLERYLSLPLLYLKMMLSIRMACEVDFCLYHIELSVFEEPLLVPLSSHKISSIVTCFITWKHIIITHNWITNINPEWILQAVSMANENKNLDKDTLFNNWNLTAVVYSMVWNLTAIVDPKFWSPTSIVIIRYFCLQFNSRTRVLSWASWALGFTWILSVRNLVIDSIHKCGCWEGEVCLTSVLLSRVSFFIGGIEESNYGFKTDTSANPFARKINPSNNFKYKRLALLLNKCNLMPYEAH